MKGEDANVADARQENPNDEAAVHTTHEGQRTDMSDFMDQVLTRTFRKRRYNAKRGDIARDIASRDFSEESEISRLRDTLRRRRCD